MHWSDFFVKFQNQSQCYKGYLRRNVEFLKESLEEILEESIVDLGEYPYGLLKESALEFVRNFVKCIPEEKESLQEFHKEALKISVRIHGTFSENSDNFRKVSMQHFWKQSIKHSKESSEKKNPGENSKEILKRFYESIPGEFY